MTPPARVTAAAAAVLLVAAALLVSRPRQAVHAAPAPVTWRTHIAPLVYNHCTGCHHPGGSGPFALTSYADAKHWATLMQTVTASRYMPPWLPEPGHGAFEGDRHLTADQIALFKAWAEAGTPEGTGPAPAPPVYTGDWQLGPPDLILEMPAPMTVPAGGTDLFENFILPTTLTGTHWVRAMEIQPGSPQVVHHANVILDRTASLRRAHPENWQRGIPGMDILVDSGESFDPDSHFLFWKPDSTALVEPPAMPWRLDAGDDLILNMHLKPTGKVETVRARIGLYFTPKAATAHPMLLQLEHDGALDIPANDSAFIVEDTLTLPIAVDVLGVYPHAHYLGKRMEGWATLPSGERRWLVLIKDWDIDRQSVYRFALPVALPRGSVVHMRYTYDNSAANPRNPNSPPIRVRAGNRSVDEMGHLWLQVLPHPAPDDQAAADPRLSLQRAWMENRLHKDPQDDVALYNLASLSMMQNDPAQAAALYRRALARRPDDARTLTSLGSAMQASGDPTAAERQYRAALAKDPAYTDALYDLASLDLHRAEQTPAGLPEAEQLLRTLTRAHPEDKDAQRLLALTYVSQGAPEKALAPLQAWQQLAPTDPEPHRALAQLYSQLGRKPDALREQRTVVTLAPNEAGDWNDLGVLEAQTGDPTAARRDLQHALTLDPANAAVRANLRKL